MNDFIISALQRHKDVLSGLEKNLVPDITKGVQLLLETVQQNRCIFTCGNGGSAADAQHLAAEFVCRYIKDRRPLKAIALTVDTSALTAIANDYSFENVFARQIKALGSTGDVLIAFSTSGQSKNILAVLAQAKTQGLRTIVMTGQRGKALAASADVAIVVPSEETARIQEMHELIYHCWMEIIEETLRADSF